MKRYNLLCLALASMISYIYTQAEKDVRIEPIEKDKLLSCAEIITKTFQRDGVFK